MAALATNWNLPLWKKLATACLFFLLIAVALFGLTPMSLLARLSENNAVGRLSVWREAVGIIPQYPLVGCGLGGFESAFLRFKTVEGLFVADYAHNDYLQLLAELGLAGFLVGAVLLGLVTKRVTRLTADASDIRWVALACIGSLTAIAVHSAFDFNLYVGANAAVLAWICGVAAGLRPPGQFPSAHVVEVERDAVIQRASASRRRSMPFR
jgi:O-antigen ligase